MRSNFTELLADMYEQLLSDYANGFDLPEETIRQILEDRENYIINLENATVNGIIDELQFFDIMLKNNNIEEKQLVKHTDYTPIATKSSKNNIAVVYMSGDITSSRGSYNTASAITSSEYVKIFDEIMANDNIKAVVLRVDSGGGSALESEIIHAKIAQLKEKKPVVASLGSAAASGGYYIVTNSHYIFADPHTMTGSIGVFGMIMNLHGVANKIGLKVEELGHGKFVNAGSAFAPFNSEFADALQLGIGDVYQEFKSRVADGRNMSLEAVETVAQGQVWSAKKALQHKLVDELGLLDDAINKAVELAETQNHSLVYYPTKKSFFDGFTLGFGIKMNQLLKIPGSLNINSDYYLNLFEEIQTHPIQMRSEFVVE
jgi:protease-4